MIFKMLKRLPFFNQDVLTLRQQKSSEIITIDLSKRFQRIKGNVMSAEDRQKYLTLLRDNFIKEQRESLIFYVYYHDENYYGILSACTQLNANFLAKSNSILIDASEFEHLMMEVEEGGIERAEENTSVWETPDIVQPSWLDQPMSAVAEHSSATTHQEVIVEEMPLPVQEAATEIVEEKIYEEVVEESVYQQEVDVASAETPEENSYALSAEEIAAIRAATNLATTPVYEEPLLNVPEQQQEIEPIALEIVQPEIFEAEASLAASESLPVVEIPVYQEPAPVFISVDMEAKPIHYAETLQETQRKALEVRQNSIELREQALRQREKAVNDWERSLNAREAESDALQDTFNIRKQAMAQKEQRLVSMEEEVLINRNALEDSFARLDEAKKEARRVLG
jgi:hypothetical protein